MTDAKPYTSSRKRTGRESKKTNLEELAFLFDILGGASLILDNHFENQEKPLFIKSLEAA